MMNIPTITRLTTIKQVERFVAKHPGEKFSFRVRNATRHGLTSVAEAKAHRAFIMGEPPDTNSIDIFMHCRNCMPLKPPDKSPRDWASLEVGWTGHGMQVWCKRCDINVVHVDFMGHYIRVV